MKLTTENILVFVSNIKDTDDVKKITPVIHLESRIRRWNVDTEDIDRVLRIEASDITPEEIIRLVQEAGFFCEEMTD